jgi:hypothetical protein
MRFLFFLFWIILFTNCKQENTSVSKFEFYPTAIIPNIDSFYKERIDTLTLIYNLNRLVTGTNDSLVIRFWPRYAFRPFESMFEFRLDSNSWRGHHYCSYTVFTGESFQYMKGHEYLGDSVFVVKNITPKCGWNKFYDSILFFQLKTLPTQALIKNFNYKAFLDGYALDFEIANRNSYRWLHYSNPDSYSYKECQLIDEFERMLIRQFDYFWLRKPK